MCSMKSIQFLESKDDNIQYVLADIDDTLTLDGRLVPSVFVAMDKLIESGIKVIPITGRPAGWCDHIARMWPVDGIVGENGAFYFYYDTTTKQMVRRYWKTESERIADRAKLNKIAAQIMESIPGAKIASDQQYREADLAIDFCEDVPRLPEMQVDEIVTLFKNAGAQAKISSIHVNGWFGDYDKLSMTGHLFREKYQVDLSDINSNVIYIGDSPNDEPMFAYFENSVGVANVKQYLKRLNSPPKWITKAEGGYGFSEMVEVLLSHRS